MRSALLSAGASTLITILLTVPLGISADPSPADDDTAGVIMGGSSTRSIDIVVDWAGRGDHATIQAAIDNATAGDTIRVWAGDYCENVIVNRTVTLEGNGTDETLVRDAGGQHVFHVTVDSVNISGFSVLDSGGTPSDNGVQLTGVSGCTICGNHASGNYYGIRLDGSTDNTIRDNVVTANTGGMRLWQGADNNTVAENDLSGNQYGALYVLFCQDCTITGNDCSDPIAGAYNLYGISLTSGSGHTVEDNQCTGCRYGIMVSGPEGCVIRGNNCSENTETGIYVQSNDIGNLIENNTCDDNGERGIYNFCADGNVITNNSCKGSERGIYTSASWYLTVDGNDCGGNQDYGIYASKPFFSNYTNNTASDAYHAGLYFYSGNNNLVEHNNFSANNHYGILLDWGTHSNVISDNICRHQEFGTGIRLLGGSSSNVIQGNDVSDQAAGIHVMDGSSVTRILKNTINNCNGGITVEWSNTCKVIGNDCSGSVVHGIRVHMAHMTVVDSNTCTGAQRGIVVTSSEDTFIRCNRLWSNGEGLRLEASAEALLDRNVCTGNDGAGIGLYQGCDKAIITGNDCGSNGAEGILLSGSVNSTVTGNFCNASATGIALSGGATSSTIDGNHVADSTGTGISMGGSSSNAVYHNNIVDNGVQAEDDGGNHWNNSLGEGNYWSDYAGCDDGTGGRPAGDGIGDTRIPHLGLDDYPFASESGWLVPGTPVLAGPGINDTDGNYTLSWTPAARAGGYVLEEDDDPSFTTPDVIYNFTGLSCAVTGRSEGEYNYRVRAHRGPCAGPWSNAVEISVDFPPGVPTGLWALPRPEGNALDLGWDGQENDTKACVLELWAESDGWEPLAELGGAATRFTHNGLTDGVEYTYRLWVRDGRGQLSPGFARASGTPGDTLAPAPPAGLAAEALSHGEVRVTWEKSGEEDVAGYHVYRSEEPDPRSWGEPLNGPAPLTWTAFIDEDCDEEEIWFYAVTALDEVPNESGTSEPASAETPLGPHGPEVARPQGLVRMWEDSADDSSIDLHRWFMDPNGDDLRYHSEGGEHIGVEIRDDDTVVLTPGADWNGQELIGFTAEDNDGAVSANVKVVVRGVNDGPWAGILSPGDGAVLEDGEAVTLRASAEDADILYGDVLTYRWRSNVSGEIGDGEEVDGVILVPGEHRISVEVRDTEGAMCLAEADVTVLGGPEGGAGESVGMDTDGGDDAVDGPPGDDGVPEKEGGQGMVAIVVAAAAAAAVIAGVVVFLQVRRKGGNKGTGTEDAKAVRAAKPVGKPVPMERPVPTGEPVPMAAPTVMAAPQPAGFPGPTSQSEPFEAPVPATAPMPVGAPTQVAVPEPFEAPAPATAPKPVGAPTQVAVPGSQPAPPVVQGPAR